MTSTLSYYRDRTASNNFLVVLTSTTASVVTSPPSTVSLVSTNAETMIDGTTGVATTQTVTYAVGTLLRETGLECLIYNKTSTGVPGVTSPYRHNATWREVTPVTTGDVVGPTTGWIIVWSASGTAITVARSG